MLSRKGITINIDGQIVIVYFECVLVVGDNLGLNCMCGFSQSFTANRYSRICSATYNQAQEMIVENKSLVRTAKSDNDALLE